MSADGDRCNVRWYSRLKLALILWLVALPALGANKTPRTLVIGAAASLRQVLSNIAAAYNSEHPEINFQFNFTASSTIVRQVVAGAAIDIFFSADEKNMDALAELGLIEKDSRRTVVGNSMLLIVSHNKRLASIANIADLQLPEIKTLALCDEAVPIGHYARTFLRDKNLLSKIKAAIVKPENVRGVLAIVQSQVADAGFVYSTDIARNDQSVRRIAIDDAALSIRYPAAVIKASKQTVLAGRFVTYLADSTTARGIFMRHGFKLL